MSSIADYNSDYFTEEDREVFSKALVRLARCDVASRRPRNTTGQVFLWKEGNVVVVRRNETLDRVFKKLTTENFLAAPVVDDTISSQYCGVIDLLDLVVYTTEVLFSGETSPAWIDFWQRSNKFKETQVHEVMKHVRARGGAAAAAGSGSGGGAIDIYHALGDGYSLLHAFETLARTGCHRVPVVNNLNRIVGIYTESMAVSDIRQSLHHFGALGELKVKDMVQSDCLFTIKESDRAIDAFRKMSELGVSGLPIVDADGILTGSISIRDLRGCGTSGEHFSRLFWTVADYKAESRRTYTQQAPPTHWTTQSLPRNARYVTPNDTFNDVVRAFNDGNLHRVFVVSQASADKGAPVPISVISQRDLIAQVLMSLGTMNAQSLT